MSMFCTAWCAAGEITDLIERLEREGKSAAEILEAVKRRCEEIFRASKAGWY